MKCRSCRSALNQQVIDLGTAPASNAYLTKDELDKAESWMPLRIMVCDQCWLVQTEDFTAPDALFDDQYAYFSSYSSSWLAHANAYVETMVDRFQLHGDSRIVEIAANDGYLLQYVKARDIPCLGIEPTQSTARAARDKGLDVRGMFFGEHVANGLRDEGWSADLMVANNVLAHVPDINDFLRGFAQLLKPSGVATFEFPHLLKLIAGKQFDTLYHEHYSYISLTALTQACQRNGLSIFDVDELETHGGSLRVYVQRADLGGRKTSAAVARLMDVEGESGVASSAYYQTLAPAAEAIKHELLRFLLDASRAGKKVVGYGAAAKGNTLLNYAGVKPDLLRWVADANPHKAGKYLPGSRIPIVSPDRIMAERPDYVLLLPWNLLQEVNDQLSEIRDWGGQLVVAVPELRIL